jgi:hypothetical protein
MKMTLARACDHAGLDLKKTNDDRNILRRETGSDFLPAPVNGRTVCDRDDVAALDFYAQQRNTGHPVKLAGVNASRLRDAMRADPDADQLTLVVQANGNHFACPTAGLDLSSGFHSGGCILTATMVDVRNLRDRVQRAVDAYEPVIGADDEA